MLTILLFKASNAIIFRCHNGACNSDDIKIAGNEITIRLKDFDDHIEFNDTEISIISRVVVSMPENINTLIIQQVHLATVYPMAFKQFYNLNTLNLAGNLLQQIDEKTFSGLGNLRWLFLAKNQIRDIHASAFGPLSDLEYLNMSYNALEYLDKRTFGSLKKLEAIYLDHNQLSLLPKGIFERNRVLKFIDLSFNELKTLHLTFYDSLFLLNLASNQLANFKMDFKVHQRENDVAILRLENNRLRSLCNVTHLKISFELNLANNQILYHPMDSIGVDLFSGFQELWSLNLSDTNFHLAHPYNLVHENPFGQMGELKELDISYNGLREIDWKQMRIQELRSLHLTGNNLTELDTKNLKKFLPNIRSIELSENNWNCSYLENLLKQLELLPDLEINVRPYLYVSEEPNINGIRCCNSTTGTSMIRTNDVVMELDHDSRLRYLEGKIDELFTKLTEALELQYNFTEILKNLSRNYDLKSGL